MLFWFGSCDDSARSCRGGKSIPKPFKKYMSFRLASACGRDTIDIESQELDGHVRFERLWTSPRQQAHRGE